MSAYANALRVIDAVAQRLQDQEIQHALLTATPVKELRLVAGGVCIAGEGGGMAG
jgi:hypothetical protein